jgi:hypothetical protein
MNTIKKQNKLKLTLNFFASLRAILKNKIDTYNILEKKGFKLKSFPAKNEIISEIRYHFRTPPVSALVASVLYFAR